MRDAPRATGRPGLCPCLAAVLLALPLASCASEEIQPAVYVHPNADFSIYERIAILPLENLTTERFAADRIRELLAVEISAQGLFQVVEPGEVNRVLRARGVANVSEIGPELIQSLGAELKVQALMIGSVIEFREQRSGTLNSPDIALSLRLMDVETGIAAWSVTDARSGLGIWTRLFGVAEENQTGAARLLIQELISTIK